MTIADYIIADFAQFGVELSQNEIDALLIDNNVSSGDLYDSKIAKKVIHSYIPKLLLKPQVSEGGYSVKYDSQAITNYYLLLCSELGLENKLNPTPKIRNRSNLW